MALRIRSRLSRTLGSGKPTILISRLLGTRAVSDLVKEAIEYIDAHGKSKK